MHILSVASVTKHLMCFGCRVSKHLWGFLMFAKHCLGFYQVYQAPFELFLRFTKHLFGLFSGLPSTCGACLTGLPSTCGACLTGLPRTCGVFFARFAQHPWCFLLGYHAPVVFFSRFTMHLWCLFAGLPSTCNALC